MRILGERYRLEGTLGSGGAATVWRARDVPAERDVAIKILDGGEGEGAEVRRDRLRKEARLLATLDHPNVVRILDVGDDGAHPYIVMELVPGGTLAERVRAEGPLAAAEATRIVIAVLGALEAAHHLGVVHRDVKPGNVLLRAERTPVLCDFGIARTDEDQTRTGVALGSMGYMAPEQRVDARTAGPPADVYAAACTLFHLVSADTPVDLYLASDSSPRWESVPAPLRPALRHATRPEPSARPLSAAQFADELRAVLPALEGLPPVRPRNHEPVGYVPTRAGPARPPPGGEPSLQERDRFVSSAEWGWAEGQRRTRVGGQAVWIAVILVAVVTVLAVNAERFLVPAAPPEAPPPPDPTGRWTGSVDGFPAELSVTPVVEGGWAAVVRVQTPGGPVTTALSGASSPTGLRLTEPQTGVPWVGEWGASEAVLQGVVHRPAGDAWFAFVHLNPAP